MRDDIYYSKFKTKANEYVQQILDSSDANKLVIAGPGTGKSYLFQEICAEFHKQGNSDILVLSFINELVVDLKRDLYKKAEVRTLHSFALGQLSRKDKFYLYLGDVI